MLVARLIGRFVVVMVALGCFAPLPLRANPADMLLLNGRIVTLDDTSSVNEALAITGDRITATGSSDQMQRLAGATTEIIDLGGRTVIPGLIDSHIHLIRAGFRYAGEVDWSGATSIADALARLRAAAVHARPGAWLNKEVTEKVDEDKNNHEWNDPPQPKLRRPAPHGEAKELGSLRSMRNVRVRAELGDYCSLLIDLFPNQSSNAYDPVNGIRGGFGSKRHAVSLERKGSNLIGAGPGLVP
jgi:Amidohydrolase family